MKKIIALLLCLALCLSGCGSLDKEITIPASFFDEGTTQESIDAVNDGNYKSATLNDDGSVTYVMTAEQHKELTDGMKAEIQSSLDELVADDTYSFVAITPNSDYTEFKVELSTDTVGFAETFSVLAFYTFGELYNICNGTPAENISVVFVNPNGDVIETANSSDAESSSSPASSSSSSSDQSEASSVSEPMTEEETTIYYDSYAIKPQVYKDSIGNTYARLVYRVENKSTVNLYLDSSVFDLEDSTGSLCATGTVTAYPQIIAPGEVAYYFQEMILNKEPEGSIKVIPHLDIEEAVNSRIDLPLTDASVTKTFGIIKVTGRVENTTNADLNNILVSVMFYNSNDVPVGHCYTYMSLKAGEKMGFETYATSVNMDGVEAYYAMAYPYQYNF